MTIVVESVWAFRRSGVLVYKAFARGHCSDFWKRYFQYLWRGWRVRVPAFTPAVRNKHLLLECLYPRCIKMHNSREQNYTAAAATAKIMV